MQNRATRRKQLRLAKQRAKKICKNWGREINNKIIGKLARSPALCSCPMCGNQRHNNWQSSKGKLTMQERRHDEDLQFGMEEQCQES